MGSFFSSCKCESDCMYSVKYEDDTIYEDAINKLSINYELKNSDIRKIYKLIGKRKKASLSI